MNVVKQRFDRGIFVYNFKTPNNGNLNYYKRYTIFYGKRDEKSKRMGK